MATVISLHRAAPRMDGFRPAAAEPLRALGHRLANLVTASRARGAAGADLAALDERLLRDIGVEHGDVEAFLARRLPREPGA